jgi:peptidoglycan/LPS O-acetylase OafA/YrhL
MFYIVFLGSYFTRHFTFFLFVWVAITIGLAISGWGKAVTVEPFATLFQPLILEFVAGMAMASIFLRASPSMWVFPLILGIVGIVIYYQLNDPHRVFFGMSLAPIVLGLALAEVRFGYRLPKPVILLGAASYAIYLIHNPLHSLVARALAGFDSWPITFGACVLGGVLVGTIYHLMLEKPVLRLLSAGGKTINLRPGV